MDPAHHHRGFVLFGIETPARFFYFILNTNDVALGNGRIAVFTWKITKQRDQCKLNQN
jgi:hypothetical protein